MKNLFQVFPKILTKHQAKTGTTIFETLAAGVMTIVVVAAAGSGVATIVGNDQKAKVNSNARIELKRGLDSIDRELKQARSIEVGGNINETVASMSSGAAAAFKAAAGTHDYSVLLVKIPNVAAPMVYYLDSPPQGSNLSGPKVVYRWGAEVGVDGKYIHPNDPTKWTVEPLIDQISDSALPQDFSCETNWTFSPAQGGEGSVSASGFYACIDSQGKIANTYLNGKMTDISGSGETHQENQKTIAMANELSSIGGPPLPLETKPIDCSIDVQGGDGKLRCNKNATLAFQVIGDDFSCSGRQRPIKTAVMVDGKYVGLYKKADGKQTHWYRAKDSILQSSFETEVAANSEVVVRSLLEYSGCYRDRYTDKSADKPFIHALKNGDEVPAYKGHDGQVDVGEYLGPYMNTADNTIKLEKNQIIYLFEMWSDPKPTSSTYDLQDNMVLVSFSSSKQ